LFENSLNEHLRCFEALKGLEGPVTAAGEVITRALVGGNKILVCGNGGSASDAQHFAAEVVGRFTRERRAYPALALSTDTSILTAVANDYGYGSIFSRQVEALGQANDVLVGISTSGNSENVIAAVKKARERGMKTIALTGGSGGQLTEQAHVAVTIPFTVTARIQEAHIFILHYWADAAEAALTGEEDAL